MLTLPPTVTLGQESEAQLSDFTIKNLLGQGAFGQVYKVVHKVSGQAYALKVIAKSMITKHKMES